MNHRPMAPMRSVVVIGLGNVLMTDEGVGVSVVDELSRQSSEFPDVDFLSAGTAGMAVVHAIAARRKAVFVDCAFMGEAPGTMRRFRPGEVVSRKQMRGLSLHEGNLLDVIEVSRNLGEVPGEIIIFGIQPAIVEPGMILSAALAGRVAQYVEAVRGELTAPA